MSDKFQHRYRIPSARWQNWDYGWNGAYSITICTAGRECYFGKIVNGKMVLSNLGIIADIFWHEITNHSDKIELDAFIVMPNHIHGILILTSNEKTGDDELGYQNNGPNVDRDVVETRHALSLQHHLQNSITPGQRRFRNQGKKTISSIIGSYKSAVSKHAHRLGFGFAWQSRFYDHVIRDDDSYQRISAYIQNNPKNWQNDGFYNAS